VFLQFARVRRGGKPKLALYTLGEDQQTRRPVTAKIVGQHPSRVLGRIEGLKPYGSVPGTEIGRYRRDCWALRFLTPLNQKE